MLHSLHLRVWSNSSNNLRQNRTIFIIIFPNLSELNYNSILLYFINYRSKYMPSSPVSMAVSLVAMVVSFLLLLADSDIALYVSTAMIGVFSGALTSLSVTMTAELFGTKHFGVNHNIVVGSIPIGSFSFGFFAAKVYRDGAALAGGDFHGKCFGMHCFQTTLVFWGMLCSIAAVLAAVLYLRNRKFYSQKP